MKYSISLLFAVALFAAYFHLIVATPADYKQPSGLSGRVIVGFKTQKILLQQGKDNNAIAASRIEEISSIAATLARVREDEGCPEINTEVVYESAGDGGFQVFEVGEGNEIAAIKALTEGENEGRYAYVEPDYIVHAAKTPNDTFLVNNDQDSVTLPLQLYNAWNISTGSSDITIGVCDSGIDIDHPDLQDNRLEGYDAISQKWESEGGIITMQHEYDHGTPVTGVAAAIGNNDVGISSIGWNFKHRMGQVAISARKSTDALISDCMR